MGYTKTITNKVTQAFKLMGDLAEEATLFNSKSETYVFPVLNEDGTLRSGGETISDTERTTIKVLVVDSFNDKGLPQREVLIRTEDLDNPNRYDLIVVRGKKYNVAHYVVSFGIITLRVTEI